MHQELLGSGFTQPAQMMNLNGKWLRNEGFDIPGADTGTASEA